MGRTRDGGGDPQGVVFPEVDGRRSTTATGMAVFADAARAADPALAEAIAGESDWRHRYVDHARRLVEVQARDAAAALEVASAGLASVHRRFAFLRGGRQVALAELSAIEVEHPLETVRVAGRGDRPAPRLEVPYRGAVLAGDDLHRQLDRWVGSGTLEPSFADAIRSVMARPDWLDLSDRTVAVLGAAAEMGPLGALCRWGARVLAVDLPRPELWRRILATARAGTGEVRIPVRTGGVDPRDDEAIALAAGADLVTALPELAAWLGAADAPLTIGNYVYADGASHVRAAVAVDALVGYLGTTRPDLSLAVLATPTDVFAVPEEVVAEARRRYAARSRLRRATFAVTGGRLFAPNYPANVGAAGGERFGIADSLVPQQGPNYALAKRIQRWRALTARATGTRSSINVAPTTGTRSVTKNRVLAAAYAGAPHFEVEVFAPATSNVLMAALLVHDLRDPAASANPDVALDHPLELFTRGAAHSGLWRQPFAPRSVLALAAARGFVTRSR